MTASRVREGLSSRSAATAMITPMIATPRTATAMTTPLRDFFGGCGEGAGPVGARNGEYGCDG
jgi:hypothetical protein